MNTPAHAVLNLLCLSRQDQATVIWPVLVGSVLPDVPIFICYFVEKVIRGTPEMTIWRESYYQAGWQNFIDVFNSVPLILLGMGLALGLRWSGAGFERLSQWGILLGLSMLLHVAGDLPLHHDDGHRHFFPFSNWRFESPVSYWDPKHYGGWVTRLEILAVLVSCGLLFQGYESWPARLSIGAIGGLYGAYFIYALRVWA